MAAIVDHIPISEKGFTLLEILVVVIIVGVVSTLVVLSAANNAPQHLRTETEKLQQVMQLAADSSLYQKKMLGLTFCQNGYFFLYYDTTTGQWITINTKPLNHQNLPQGITLSLMQDGQSSPLQEQCPTSPQILFFPSGEITPFTLTIAFSSLKNEEALTTNGLSSIERNNVIAP